MAGHVRGGGEPQRQRVRAAQGARHAAGRPALHRDAGPPRIPPGRARAGGGGAPALAGRAALQAVLFRARGRVPRGGPGRRPHHPPQPPRAGWPCGRRARSSSTAAPAWIRRRPARALQVDAVVDGTLQRDGTRLRIGVQLVPVQRRRPDLEPDVRGGGHRPLRGAGRDGGAGRARAGPRAARAREGRCSPTATPRTSPPRSRTSRAGTSGAASPGPGWRRRSRSSRRRRSAIPATRCPTPASPTPA